MISHNGVWVFLRQVSEGKHCNLLLVPTSRQVTPLGFNFAQTGKRDVSWCWQLVILVPFSCLFHFHECMSSLLYLWNSSNKISCLYSWVAAIHRMQTITRAVLFQNSILCFFSHYVISVLIFHLWQISLSVIVLDRFNIISKHLGSISDLYLYYSLFLLLITISDNWT